MKDNTRFKDAPDLLQALFTLIQAHRPAFRQERPYRRAVGLILGELFSFARHTLTQGLLALGIKDGDWSAWYRLFSRARFDEAELGKCLLQETLEDVSPTELYAAAVDSTSFHRSSLKMRCTCSPVRGHTNRSCPNRYPTLELDSPSVCRRYIRTQIQSISIAN